MKRTILLILAIGCRDRAAVAPEAAGVESGSLSATAAPNIATADTVTLHVPLTLPSQLYVEHDATVYARSGGIVESILVDLGTRVAAGQLMARLESADQQIAMEQASEKLVNSRRMAERQRELKAAGVVTTADSERVEFEHREAVLSHRKAQRDLDLTRIVAPFSGVVTARTARLGRLVSAGDSLFRLTAQRPVLAAVRVPEAAAAGLSVGAEATVLGPGGITSRARVIRASPIIEAGSGTREMILQLADPGSRFTPGTSVTIRLGSERRQVVAIPRTAVAKDGYAMVWADDRTTLRPLTLGSDLDDDRIEIVSGLAPGEKVIRTAP